MRWSLVGLISRLFMIGHVLDTRLRLCMFRAHKPLFYERGGKESNASGNSVHDEHIPNTPEIRSLHGVMLRRVLDGTYHFNIRRGILTRERIKVGAIETNGDKRRILSSHNTLKNHTTQHNRQ